MVRWQEIICFPTITLGAPNCECILNRLNIFQNRIRHKTQLLVPFAIAKSTLRYCGFHNSGHHLHQEGALPYTYLWTFYSFYYLKHVFTLEPRTQIVTKL